MANQHLCDNNNVWEKIVVFRFHLITETTMFRIKTLLGEHQNLHEYDAQVGKAIANVKALNWLTLFGMSPSIRII